MTFGAIFAACYPLDQLNLWTIGAIVSAILYGGLLSCTLSFVPLLLKTSYDVSRSTRIFLLVYVTIMVAISTTAIIITVVALMNNMAFGRSNHGLQRHCMTAGALAVFQSGFLETLCTVLASWGADGCMLWRCAMIYRGVSRPRRIALIGVLTSLGLMSLGSCLTFLVIYSQESFLFLLIASITVFLNLVTATLITLRILYFERYIRETVGLERNSPYMTIIYICVESSALIVVFSLIYLIMYSRLRSEGASTSLIPMQALVHVYVISPLLIVYRVARGKAATIRQRPSESGPPVSVLYFEPQTLSPSNHTA